MSMQNAESWDTRELGASEDHVGAVALDLEVDEENKKPPLEAASETR
jgi:hypothetical protein